MTIIVDGYNVLHNSPELSGLLEENLEVARKSLIQKLVKHQEISGDQVVVVFDSRLVGIELNQESLGKGVKIIYAPANITADKSIVHLLRNKAFGKRPTVVTNDRELIESVKRQGVKTMAVSDLGKRVDASHDELPASSSRNYGRITIADLLDSQTLNSLKKLRAELKDQPQEKRHKRR